MVCMTAFQRAFPAGARSKIRVSKIRRTASHFLRPLPLFDQLPEALAVGQHLILVARDLAAVAKKEIAQRILVQHTMHTHSAVHHFKIDAITFSPVAVERLSVALQFPKPLAVHLLQILRRHLELRKQFQLEHGIQLADLGGTQFIEDDLKHAAAIIGNSGLKSAHFALSPAAGTRPVAAMNLPVTQIPCHRIAIIGSGAVGCYYGGRLALGGCDVRFLMRRDLNHVRQHGLTVKSHLGDFTLPQAQAFGSTEEMGPADLVIVTLKATDNSALDAIIPPLLGEHTSILTLQNGLGNEEYLADRWGAKRVLGGVCFTCINRTAPGVIEHTAQGQVALGARVSGARAAATRACEVFNACGIDCTFADSITAVRWKKLVWNIPFNGLAILGGGIPTNQILADPPLHALACSLMSEIIGISNHLGHLLPDTFVQDQIAATETMRDYRPSSMLDFVAGRDVEVEAIWGEPWRRALAAGIQAPRLETLYQLIRSAADRRPNCSGPDPGVEPPGCRLSV